MFDSKEQNNQTHFNNTVYTLASFWYSRGNAGIINQCSCDIKKYIFWDSMCLGKTRSLH